MAVQQNQKQIRIRPCSHCYLCGSVGKLFYRNLKDHSFGVVGNWNLLYCSVCKLFWLSPQPIPEDINLIYEDYQTHKVHIEKRKFSTIRNEVTKRVLGKYYGYSQMSELTNVGLFSTLLSCLPLVKDSEGMDIMHLSAADKGLILDVGCGNGTFLAKMKNLGWQVCGTEVDENAALAARKEFGLEVFIGELKDAVFSNDFFDVITLGHVVEHLYDPIELLEECKRILKPNGKLIITTPNTSGLACRIFKQWWRGFEPPRHMMIFSLTSLECCLQKAGFDSIILRSSARMGRSLYIASKLIQMADKGSSTNILGSVNTWLSIKGYFFQIMEAIIRSFYKEAGEEIYYVGAKSNLSG